MRISGSTATVLIAWCVLGAATLRAATSVELVLTTPADQWFEEKTSAGVAPIVTEAGQVAVIGLVDYTGFAAKDISRVTVLAPDGQKLKLIIEQESITWDFDEIVAFRCYFIVKTSSLGDRFQLAWGPEITAENKTVPQLLLDPSNRQNYRQFIRKKTAAQTGAETSVASIEIIADSTAEYHFLWYLLPIAVIFALLTMRKIHARHSAHRTDS